MDPTILDRRPLVPTVAAAREPVERYWAGYAPELAADGTPGAGLDDALDPLDGLLVHLLLGLLPADAVVVDLAAGATAGTTAVVGLAHPGVRKVVAGLAGGAGSLLVAAALRAYAADHAAPGKLDISPAADGPADVAARHGPVVVADPRAYPGGPAELAGAVGRWLDARPDAVVFVLGVGPLGGDGAAEALVRLAGGRAVWLLREAAEALAGSRLAVVARPGHPAADAVRRVGLMYTGNTSYLDLLCRANGAAVAATGADAAAMRVHPSAAPVFAELDHLKAQLTAAKNELDWLRSHLAWANSHTARTDDLVAAVDWHARELADIRRSLAYRAADRVRATRAKLVPPGSRRYSLYDRLRRAGRGWRAGGVRGLARSLFGRP